MPLIITKLVSINIIDLEVIITNRASDPSSDNV